MFRKQIVTWLLLVALLCGITACAPIGDDTAASPDVTPSAGVVSPSSTPVSAQPSPTESPSPTPTEPPSATPTTPSTSATAAPQTVTGELAISYLDVGQGDSIYILLPNGETMLIDAGEKSSGSGIVSHIKGSGETKLDYVVATHPHADHIGGMATVITSFTVGELWMPDVTHTTATFETLLAAIDEQGLGISVATAGVTIFDYGNLKAEFLAPNSGSYSDLNNYSAVVMLTYGDSRFLFMGDAEAKSENEILAAGYDVSADVLKVGHHGSNTSSTRAFVQSVSPDYAVISCGAGNSYGHPTAATLATFADIDVRRTDTMGTITVTSDGKSVKVSNSKTPTSTPPATASAPSATETSTPTPPEETQQQQSVTVYVTNTGSKYHNSGCRYLSKSKIAISLESARRSYDPCSVCKPPQ